MRGLELKTKHICDACNTMFSNSANLHIHQDSCKEFAMLELRTNYEQQIQTLTTNYEQQIQTLTTNYEQKFNTLKYTHENFKQDQEKIITGITILHEQEKKDLQQKLELSYATIENKHQKLELAYASIENEDQKLKIRQLTTKYVKAQPRVEYVDQNVIYILTTPSHKIERKYILGKATNLTSRLSTYNKTDEHEVVYYQSCPDEDSMSLVEQVVFQKLKDYKERANRERFILPENAPIELFINTIKKAIEFIK